MIIKYYKLELSFYLFQQIWVNEQVFLKIFHAKMADLKMQDVYGSKYSLTSVVCQRHDENRCQQPSSNLKCLSVIRFTLAFSMWSKRLFFHKWYQCLKTKWKFLFTTTVTKSRIRRWRKNRRERSWMSVPTMPMTSHRSQCHKTFWASLLTLSAKS